MSAKFEDLVKAINEASSEWGLASLSFQTIKDAVNDLDARLQALEAAAQAKTTEGSVQ